MGASPFSLGISNPLNDRDATRGCTLASTAIISPLHSFTEATRFHTGSFRLGTRDYPPTLALDRLRVGPSVPRTQVQLWRSPGGRAASVWLPQPVRRSRQ